MGVRFCDDAEMKKINRSFRGKNTTTDVLTFPADDSFDEPGQQGHYLGDIVISIDRAKAQAREERHSLSTEVKYLLLHGIIHALGFDHETDEGGMNKLELAVRERVGLK
jgi:probable rRNA maturation factor